MSNRHPVTCVPFDHDLLKVVAAQLLGEHGTRLPLLDEVVVLVPEPEAAPLLRQHLLEAAAAAGHAALLGPRIQSLPEWVEEQPLAADEVVGDHMRELMLVEALRQHRDLFGHGNLWALADALLKLFDELTLNKVGLPPDLETFRQRLARWYGADNSRLSALGMEAQVVHTLWRAWHDQLRARRQIDRPSAYLLRLAASLDTLRQPLYIAGYNRFSRAEQEWLQQLIQRDQLRLFRYGVPATDDPLYPFCGAPEHDDNPPSPYGDLLRHGLHPWPEPLRQRSQEFAARHPASPAGGRLRLFHADGAEQEAQAVELQVRRWLLEGCDSIAVVTENRRLARRVRALLERADIALQDAAGWALSTTSAAAALERWLQCVEEDFPYQAMLDLLKSPFVFAGEERAARLADVYRLEQGVVLQGKIGRGLQRYRRQLAYRSRLLPDEFGPELERVAALLELLERAVSPLRPFITGSGHPPQAILTALHTSLQTLGLAGGFDTDAAGRLVLQVLEEMRLATAEETPVMAWTEFRAWLGRTLEQTNFRPPVGNAQVQLMGLEQSRLGRFDALVIAGAELEHLPGNSAASPFFNQTVRAELGLPTSEQRRLERRQQFERLLHSAPAILLTLRRQQDGEEILPSPWLEGIRSFHQLAYSDDLEEPVLAQWLREGCALVQRCDIDTVPPLATQPAPPLPPQLFPRTLSASGYQQLVDCPYQFYAARGLGLAPPETIREALEKADYGERVHRCLQAFHSGSAGLPGPFATTLTPANRNEAQALLLQITDAVFAEDLEDNYLHRAWRDRWRALIPAYLEWQMAHEAEQWRVAQAELDLRREEFAPGLTLKGRLDRVDRSPQGSAVLDYKTGTVPSMESVEQGEAVQLPFYATLLGAEASRVEYVALERDRVVSRATLEGEQLDALRQANEERLTAVVRDVMRGTPMPAWGDEWSCSVCAMSGICRRAMWIGNP